MDRVKNQLKKCRLYNFNSRKGIIHLLNIPMNLNLDDIRKNMSEFYSFFYLKKPTKSKKKLSKEEIKNNYLSIDDYLEIYDERPADYSKDKYRMLINIRDKWLKKTLKKLINYCLYHLLKKTKKKSNIQFRIYILL